MPSYRVTLTIGALRPGVAPDAVLPAAAAAAAELTTVEASDINVVSGMPRMIVRFTADDAEVAVQIARHVAQVTDGVAEPLAWNVTERVKSRWIHVRK